ncbi:MAG: hypothetical protein K6A75_10840 [Ruminococcus sp.]|nr:hypothetical protein [Ruminococcus sp.]
MILYIDQNHNTLGKVFNIRDEDKKNKYYAKVNRIPFASKIKIINSTNNTVATIQKRIIALFPKYVITLHDNKEYTISLEFNFSPKFFVSTVNWVVDYNSPNINISVLKNSIANVKINSTEKYSHYVLETKVDISEVLAVATIIAVDLIIAEENKKGEKAMKKNEREFFKFY